MVEFAFVNTIWRRKNSVSVKKLNSKRILKSTLSPTLLRRKSHTRSKSFSGVALKKAMFAGSLGGEPNFNNYLTVNLPITTINEGQGLGNTHKKLDVNFVESAFGGIVAARSTGTVKSAAPTSQSGSNNRLDNSSREALNEEEANFSGWTTLTPQEIGIWIDSRARFVFFLLFRWPFLFFG
ncbi:hypothetical protein KR067_007439, partial [Drosophila pandora]